MDSSPIVACGVERGADAPFHAVAKFEYRYRESRPDGPLASLLRTLRRLFGGAGGRRR